MIAGEFKIGSLPYHKFAYSLISRYRYDTNFKYESGIIENGSFFMCRIFAGKISILTLLNGNLHNKEFLIFII